MKNIKHNSIRYLELYSKIFNLGDFYSVEISGHNYTFMGKFNYVIAKKCKSLNMKFKISNDGYVAFSKHSLIIILT
jgi:hypothetical protein